MSHSVSFGFLCLLPPCQMVGRCGSFVAARHAWSFPTQTTTMSIPSMRSIGNRNSAAMRVHWHQNAGHSGRLVGLLWANSLLHLCDKAGTQISLARDSTLQSLYWRHGCAQPTLPLVSGSGGHQHLWMVWLAEHQWQEHRQPQERPHGGPTARRNAWCAFFVSYQRMRLPMISSSLIGRTASSCKGLGVEESLVALPGFCSDWLVHQALRFITDTKRMVFSKSHPSTWGLKGNDYSWPWWWQWS